MVTAKRPFFELKNYTFYPNPAIRSRFGALSVTELGDKFLPRIPARKMNHILCRLGFQNKAIAGSYALTDKGTRFGVQFQVKPGAEILPTIVWSPDIIPVLKNFLEGGIIV